MPTHLSDQTNKWMMTAGLNLIAQALSIYDSDLRLAICNQPFRTMFNLPEDLPLVAPSYSRKKAAFAKEAGFGKYSRAGSAGQAGSKAPVE